MQQSLVKGYFLSSYDCMAHKIIVRDQIPFGTTWKIVLATAAQLVGTTYPVTGRQRSRVV